MPPETPSLTEMGAITALDALTGIDQEADHRTADDTLVAFLNDNGHREVAAAFWRARNRVVFWYS